MKSVLISIQPYWVFLIIANLMGWNIGKQKTVEVRKSYPKDENWSRVAKIYCSKDKKSFSKIPNEYQPLMERFLGKVIGEFVCDDCSLLTKAHYGYIEQYGCIPREDLKKYMGIGERRELSYSDGCHGWHISDLVIYDDPKPLTDFAVMECLWHNIRNNGCVDASGEKCLDCRLKRPPQSWCYVEG